MSPQKTFQHSKRPVRKQLKQIIYSRPFIWLAYYLIRIYARTFRMTVENESLWKNYRKQNHPVILCTWHQQFFAAIRHFKTYAPYNPGLMISQSRDGDLISGVANQTGWHTPRGSSTRGGKMALTAMIAHIRQHGFGAHILDGPQGPMGKVKPGIIKMARETRAVIVPFYVRADRAWFFNSWDRFMLPKPFARVCLTFSTPLQAHDNEGDFAAQRQTLEAVMRPWLLP